MTSEETPLGHLDEVRPEEASSPLTADVNENDANVTRNEEIMVQSRDAQDSINNNENCNLMCGQLSCKNSYEDNDHLVAEGLTTAALTSRETPSTKGKRINGRRSNRNRKNCNGKSMEFVIGDVDPSQESKPLASICELSISDPNACPEQRNQKQLRDSLFSLIREGFEQKNDARMLPTCLHQIAETYFHEEDYEKAIQFIQLERLYHEQLLANLSAIQEQWESKWKTTDISLPSPNNLDKGLSSKELERLNNLCGSHHDPQMSKHKISDSERCVRIQGASQLAIPDDHHDVDGPAGSPDRENHPGSRPKKDGKPGVAAMTENSPPSVRAAEDITKAADHLSMPGLGHTEEQQPCSSEETAEPHTQSTGTVGRANSVSLLSGDAVRNNNLLQPEATPHCNDVSGIEVCPRDHRGVQPGKPMVDKLISAGTDHADHVSGSQDDLPGERSCFHFDCLDQNAQVANGEEEHYAEIGDVKESPNSVNADTSESLSSTAHQICSQDTERAAQRQATVEFLASLLNSDLKDSENFLTHLDFQEEDMSPSPEDAILGDNYLSLDELAKRIEVEEMHPAAGLVSILKKRSENEGALSKQQTKQTKRKVHFQEADDDLDQEEIGGGSCFLLILLCIATVFLSVGGTAIYCTFGDEESSMCKDFSANMDFYYTQLLQGVEELKHWLSVT
ncbi:consortin [Pelodytes ibericus]